MKHFRLLYALIIVALMGCTSAATKLEMPDGNSRVPINKGV